MSQNEKQAWSEPSIAQLQADVGSLRAEVADWAILWQLAERDPKALRQLDRLLRIEETLEAIAQDGCGNAIPLDPHDHGKGWETCAERLPGEQGEWCWSCIARWALGNDQVQPGSDAERDG